MSISLPNGTLLANPSTQTQYTAAVTRILHLSSFPPELKTRDLQVMFKDYEAEKGGFRIKWLDDVNALVVFSDAGVAKRAYLSFLLSPPPAFPLPAKIRPYDRPDAAQIIQAMTARSMGHRSSMSSAMTSGNVFNQSHSHTQSQGQGGIDGLPSHSRTMSMGTNTVNGGGGGGGGMGTFAFPKTGRSSISSRPTSIIGGNTSTITSSHGRSGSSSFSRSSNTGLGALNFGGSSSLSNRLPTHAESLDSPNRPSAPFPVRRTTKESELSRSASSSDTEPIVVMDQAPSLPAVPGFAGWKMPSSKAPMGARRESVSAEKALREVEKALAGVEAR